MNNISFGSECETARIKDLKEGQCYISISESGLYLYVGRNIENGNLIFYRLCSLVLSYNSSMSCLTLQHSAVQDQIVRYALDLHLKNPSCECIRVDRGGRSFMRTAYPGLSVPVKMLVKWWLKLSMMNNLDVIPTIAKGVDENGNAVYKPNSIYCKVKDLEIGGLYKTLSSYMYYVYLGRDSDNNFIWTSIYFGSSNTPITEDDLFVDNNYDIVNLKSNKRVIKVDKYPSDYQVNINKLREKLINTISGWHER